MRITESAGGIVLAPDGRVLVVSQRGHTWSLPKGHIDPGEAPLATARREIHEESGVSDLELVESLGSYVRHRITLTGGEDRAERKTIHMFLFRTAETRLAPQDPDNPEARWVQRDEVCDLLSHPKDRAFYQAQVARVEAALSR